MRERWIVVLLVAVGLLAGGPVARAQVPDHLKCYRVKDALKKSRYVADLNGLAREPGCIVSMPATFECVETQKENVRPAPPGAPGAGPAGHFLCYKAKCPKAEYASRRVKDQFGERTIRATQATLLCAPAIDVSTTSTTTTTSTTLPCVTCDNLRCPACAECKTDPATGEAFCAGTCDGCSCRAGTHCELEPVACLREPCPPIARCVNDSPCDLPIVPGPCDAQLPRWAFDGEQCVAFNYGGCGGNANNFSTAAECRKACIDVVTTTSAPPTTTTTTLPPTCDPPCGECARCVTNAATGGSYCADTCEECPCPAGTHCQLQSVQCLVPPCPPVAKCAANLPCTLPIERGPCDAALPRWGFSTADGACKPFVYGGCGGNANNFPSEGQCQRVCGGTVAEPCDDPCKNVRCQSHQQCLVDRTSGAGYCADTCERFSCPPDARCELQQVQCVTSPCPPVARCVPRDVCDQPVTPGPCDAALLRWYHDATTGICRPFTYGGCGGNANNFSTAADCERACPPLPLCEQPKDPGPCDAAIQRWWHNPGTGQCEPFIWGGCGGNQNNFPTERDCKAACS